MPDEAILKEVQGRSTYESLAATSRFLRDRDVDDVVLVTSPAHAARVDSIADEVGLHGGVSPTGHRALAVPRTGDAGGRRRSGPGLRSARRPRPLTRAPRGVAPASSRSAAEERLRRGLVELAPVARRRSVRTRWGAAGEWRRRLPDTLTST